MTLASSSSPASCIILRYHNIFLFDSLNLSAITKFSDDDIVMLLLLSLLLSLLLLLYKSLYRIHYCFLTIWFTNYLYDLIILAYKKITMNVFIMIMLNHMLPRF